MLRVGPKGSQRGCDRARGLHEVRLERKVGLLMPGFVAQGKGFAFDSEENVSS